jgi:hypothetical protein
MGDNGDAADGFSFVAVAFLLIPALGNGVSAERATY